MPLCPHDWRPMTAALDECATCGAQRTPPTPYCHQQDGGIVTPNAAAIADRWRELNAEHAARMFADAESRFMAHRAPLPEGSDIIVPDIHGEPTTWTPIASTEQESDD